MTKNHQMSETFLLGMLLAIVGGYLDAYTYICRDHVFANAQTGNMVLLGLNLAEHNIPKAFHYAIPVIAYAVGVIIAELIKTKYKTSKTIHWRQIIIIIEILVLIVVAFIPSGSMNVAANIAISFVCAMQAQSFRKLHGNAYTTTMCTGNLRSATEQLVHYAQTKDKALFNKSLQYFGIIGFFIIGAIIGTLLTNKFSVTSIWFCCCMLIAVFILMFVRNEELN